MWSHITFLKTLQSAVYALVCLDTGFRPSETAGLRWRDWHAGLHGFTCSGSVSSRGVYKDSIKTTGHGIGTKIGMLSPRTERLLLSLPRAEDGFIFHSSPGHLLTSTTALYRLARAEDRAGLERLPTYCLRHTFDTAMMKKLPLEQVNLLMGHTSYHREYDHRTGEDMLRQVQDARDTMFHSVVDRKEK